MACPFCDIASGDLTPEVVACRDQHTVAFPCKTQQPRNQGHMLVVPVAHIRSRFQEPAEPGAFRGIPSSS